MSGGGYAGRKKKGEIKDIYKVFLGLNNWKKKVNHWLRLEEMQTFADLWGQSRVVLFCFV